MPVAAQPFRTTPVLSVSGDLDLSNAQDLRAMIDTIAAACPSTVSTLIVDLRDVPLLSAAALAVLLAARDEYAGRLSLHVVATGECARVLTAGARFDGLPLSSSVDAAIDTTAPQGPPVSPARAAGAAP
ncbi:MAG TPA: STAS domain-containing protein [Segeticoccus sp.]|nr:STAS domain-containing protein [Segeticoccus sp.]